MNLTWSSHVFELELRVDGVFAVSRAPWSRLHVDERHVRDGFPHRGVTRRESLKEILLYAGIKNQPAVFLFSDTQIVFEAMLEDVNNVLNTVRVRELC